MGWCSWDRGGGMKGEGGEGEGEGGGGKLEAGEVENFLFVCANRFAGCSNQVPFVICKESFHFT